jgi:hypothetical protein
LHDGGEKFFWLGGLLQKGQLNVRLPFMNPAGNWNGNVVNKGDAMHRQALKLHKGCSLLSLSSFLFYEGEAHFSSTLQ